MSGKPPSQDDKRSPLLRANSLLRSASTPAIHFWTPHASTPWRVPSPDGPHQGNIMPMNSPVNESSEPFRPSSHTSAPMLPRKKKTSNGSYSYGSVDDVEPQRCVDLASPVNNIEIVSQPDPTGIIRCQSPSGGPSFVVNDGPGPGPGQSRCECHVKVEDDTTRVAKIKLIVALVIALAFMIGEVLGGYFSGSLAIMTDAAHMLSDFAGFLISLFAIWLGSQPASKRMSFGWHRAEVVGAVISVLIIWVLTGVLFYEAVKRILNPTFEVNADIMLITACVGVFVNVFMCMVLHQHSHGHSHGGGGRHRKKKTYVAINEESIGDEKESRRVRKKRAGDQQNINVRAAFIHVIGDLIQSIGVVIAGYVISFKPEWKIIDPICTFLFCILVLISTLNVMKDALRVLMEGTPKHINYKEVKEDLSGIPGVKQAHSLHIWSLTMNRIALSAHLVLDPESNVSVRKPQDVLDEASRMLKENYNITQTTIQVEEYHMRMGDCNTCQEENLAGFFSCNCFSTK